LALHLGKEFFGRIVIFRPHNVYGPDMGTEHVVPQFALRLAKLMRTAAGGVIDFPIEGTGEETRAFIYIDDFVDAARLVMDRGEHLGIYHIGTDVETTIDQLACAVARCAGCQIRLAPGPIKPGGTPRRCPDISKLRKLGFAAKFDLGQGLQKTVPWYIQHAQRSAA
jgi:nucleoside-diphosphate-sugar epimerase